MTDPALAPAPPARARAGLPRVLLQIGAYRLLLAGLLLWWAAHDPFRMPPEGHVFFHEVAAPSGPVGQLCTRWDSFWFLNIVEFGYQPREQGQSNTAFFPAYPYLLRGFRWLGCDAATAGALLSTGCFLLALICAYRYAERQSGAGAGAATALWLCVFPSSWVFHMVFSDALFCAAVFGFLLLYAQNRYGQAALVGLGIPLIRGLGLALGVALAIDVAVRWHTDKKPPRGPLLALGGCLLGVAALSAAYWGINGSPLGFLGQGRAWALDWGLQEAWSPVLHAMLTLPSNPNVQLAWVFWLVQLAALVCLWLQRRNLGTYFVTVYLIVVLLFSVHNSQLRYMLALLPLHAVIASFLQRKGWLTSVVLILAALQLVATRMYLDWILTL